MKYNIQNYKHKNAKNEYKILKAVDKQNVITEQKEIHEMALSSKKKKLFTM